jgi:acyl transferase domain-containing protein
MTINGDDREADVAIIGMAGRFPGAATLDEFWNNLRDGVNSITYFSAEELSAAGVAESTLNDPEYVCAAPMLDRVDEFDAAFFGYAPREAAFIDPQQRLLLECAWEALEHAGYCTPSHPYPVGVYAGSSVNTYFLSSGLHTRLTRDFVLALSGSDKDFLATRIAYKLNLQGTAITVQTACSTSLAAVHVACQSLFNGENDLAIAGGVSVKVPQKAGYYCQPGGIVSHDGRVRTFDEGATGTVFGSAAGMVVLKRLPDALRDGDCIHAVIKGSAINNDGSAKANFTAPSVNRQADVVVEALARAGIRAETLSYVEAHGTGTHLGDPIEIAALTKAFQSDTRRTEFCAIGSVKPNIGHAEAASGIVSLLKTVLALEKEAIPPLVHFEKPNPNIDFANSPFFPSRTLLSWPRNVNPRRAGVNSLGVGGTNVHVILEEAPHRGPAESGRKLHILPISARSDAALDALRRRLTEYFQDSGASSLADVAYTLQVGRWPMEYRSYAVCGVDENPPVFLAAPGMTSRRIPKDQTRPVFLFPPPSLALKSGFEELYANEPLFRKGIDWSGATLRSLGITADPLSPDCENEAADRLVVDFVIEYQLAQLWLQWGVKPSLLVGQGLGEIVAACVACALPWEEAVRRISEQTTNGIQLHSAGHIPCQLASTGRLLTGSETLQPISKVPVREPLWATLPAESYLFLEIGDHFDGWRLETMGARKAVVLASLPSANESAVRQLLTAKGEIWMAGVDIDWSKAWEGERRRRVPLPTYPFQRRRVWFDAIPAGA